MSFMVVDSENDFESILYGANKHPGTVEYLRNQVTDFTNRFGGMMTEAAQSFVARVNETYDAFNGSEALRRAKAALSRAGSVFQENTIRHISTLEGLQQAPLIMQRWAMSQPDLRLLYHRQRCSGYEGDYVDVAPGDIGENHRDWRMVHDGVLEDITLEDGTETYKVTNYIDIVDEEDPQLDLAQQMDIQDTYHYIKLAVQMKLNDPSSKFGGLL